MVINRGINWKIFKHQHPSSIKESHDNIIIRAMKDEKKF